MICQNCNKKISDDSIFCEYCGEKIIKNYNKEPDVYRQVLDHLEFLGYQIKINENKEDYLICFATHETKNKLTILFEKTVGFTFLVRYKFDKNKMKKYKTTILEDVNRINNENSIIHFSLSSDYESIEFSSWFPPLYSKKIFSNFITFFESQILKIIQNLNPKIWY